MKRKTLRKLLYLAIIATAVYTASVFFYSQYFHTIDTKEIDLYYDMLSKHQRPSSGIVFDMGSDHGSSLDATFKRLCESFGFSGFTLVLTRTKDASRPARIIRNEFGSVEVRLSERITQRREQVNVLIHELCHIYVWRLDPKIFGRCDQEKLTDCAGVFLGFGIPILNGLTDEFILIPGGGFESQSKFFGYLKPEQFGYLLARYAKDHNIPNADIIEHLNDAGKKYFSLGSDHLKKKLPPININ